jgi:hypothetical protein
MSCSLAVAVEKVALLASMTEQAGTSLADTTPVAQNTAQPYRRITLSQGKQGCQREYGVSCTRVLLHSREQAVLEEPGSGCDFPGQGRP